MAIQKSFLWSCSLCLVDLVNTVVMVYANDVLKHCDLTFSQFLKDMFFEGRCDLHNVIVFGQGHLFPGVQGSGRGNHFRTKCFGNLVGLPLPVVRPNYLGRSVPLQGLSRIGRTVLWTSPRTPSNLLTHPFISERFSSLQERQGWEEMLRGGAFLIFAISGGEHPRIPLAGIDGGQYGAVDGGHALLGLPYTLSLSPPLA